MKPIFMMSDAERRDYARSIPLTSEEVAVAKNLTAGDPLALEKRLDGLRALKLQEQAAAELNAVGKK